MGIKFLPNEEYVRVLGRTIRFDGGRILSTSGSGVEFVYTGTKLTVTFLGDSSCNNASDLVYWRDIARVQVLVDGRIMLDTTIKKDRESFVVYGEDLATPIEEHLVQIIKISEPRMSNVGLGEIEIEAKEYPKPGKAKDKLIEFIGDSITCGYGVDTMDELCPFSTGTENATKAYAYMAAKELDVDYSLISYSGHGFVSGWTPDSNKPQKAELIQPYYEIVAYSYNNFRGIKPQDYKWDFSVCPDVIVINIGTNDFSYTQDDEGKIAEYEKEYLDFLHVVRNNNPKAHIICALGVMGDDLFAAVRRVVKNFVAETGDENISDFHFTPQNPEADGYAADSHPSFASQKKAAGQLVRELKKYLI